VDKNIREKRY